MTLLKTISSAIICLFLVISVCVTSFAADESRISNKSKCYRDVDGEFMIASDGGDTSEYPENSISAINSAVLKGADIIKIYVRQTADSVLILMRDNTLERTCHGASSENVVSEMTFEQISKFNLLKSKGGCGAAKTSESVPTLEAVLKLNPDCLIMIDFDWEIKDSVYKLVADYDMLESVIFYIDDEKPSSTADWKKTLGYDIMTMSYFKGNVIFSSISNVKKAAEASQAIHLASKVPYAVNFGKGVQNTAYNGGLRTMASVCTPELCGTIMTDTEKWWDYLFSSGISIILTDRISELSAYLDGAQEKYDKLKKVYAELVENWTLPDFNSDNYHDYKLAYTNAEEKARLLLSKKSCSESEAEQAAFELKKAYDDINTNYELFEKGVAGLTITPIRVFLAIAVIAAAVSAEIYIFKKKKK